METPSSTTRSVTKSHTIIASNSDNSLSTKTPRQQQQQQHDRCALVDITNDSPIVGLANCDGCIETPMSSVSKQRGRSRVMQSTPGSGEALLRGQVKTLLQRVEEEAEVSKLSLEIRPFPQLVKSPMGLLAPTPANTPQIPNGLASVPPSPIVEEHLISRVVNQIFDGNNGENSECEKGLIGRSLLLEFSDKSEVSECFSELTHQEEDDAASIWSLQVNASSHDEDEDEGEMAEKEDNDYYEDVEEGEYDDDGGLMLVDELCEGLNNISVSEKVAPKVAGKHTRFVYNSDDELVEEVEVEQCAEVDSNMLRLKGLPTPKGKHLRFPVEDEEKSAL